MGLRNAMNNRELDNFIKNTVPIEDGEVLKFPENAAQSTLEDERAARLEELLASAIPESKADLTKGERGEIELLKDQRAVSEDLQVLHVPAEVLDDAWAREISKFTGILIIDGSYQEIPASSRTLLEKGGAFKIFKTL